MIAPKQTPILEGTDMRLRLSDRRICASPHTRTHAKASLRMDVHACTHALARSRARSCAPTRTHTWARTPIHAHQIGPGFAASPLVYSGMGCRLCLNLRVGSGIVQARIARFSLRDRRILTSPKQLATSGLATRSMPMSHDRLVLPCVLVCLLASSLAYLIVCGFCLFACPSAPKHVSTNGLVAIWLDGPVSVGPWLSAFVRECPSSFGLRTILSQDGWQ